MSKTVIPSNVAIEMFFNLLFTGTYNDVSQ